MKSSEFPLSLIAFSVGIFSVSTIFPWQSGLSTSCRSWNTTFSGLFICLPSITPLNAFFFVQPTIVVFMFFSFLRFFGFSSCLLFCDNKHKINRPLPGGFFSAEALRKFHRVLPIILTFTATSYHSRLFHFRLRSFTDLVVVIVMFVGHM